MPVSNYIQKFHTRSSLWLRTTTATVQTVLPSVNESAPNRFREAIYSHITAESSYISVYVERWILELVFRQYRTACV